MRAVPPETPMPTLPVGSKVEFFGEHGEGKLHRDVLAHGCDASLIVHYRGQSRVRRYYFESMMMDDAECQISSSSFVV